MDVCSAVTRPIAPACDSSLESLQRFFSLLHTSVRDRQTKPWSARRFPRFLVECNRLIETSHLAIQSCQRWFTIMGKCRIELERSFSRGDGFIVKAEIPI